MASIAQLTERLEIQVDGSETVTNGIQHYLEERGLSNLLECASFSAYATAATSRERTQSILRYCVDIIASTQSCI